MEPEARYRALLDSEAPADLWDAAMQGEVQREYLMYKCLNRSEAEGYEDEIEPYLDFRSSTGRCALVRCSACGEQMLADYLPSKQDRANRSGIRLWRDGEKQDCRDGQKLVCPLCGAAADVEHVSGMRWGRGQEAWVVVPQLQNGILAFTEWYCTRRVYLDREIHSNEPVCCYLADTEKRKVVRCNLCRRGMGGHLYRLEGWEQTKRLVDRCGAVRKLYDRVLPDLAGTSLAKSRLWEYRDSAGQEFCPISYIRLYWKHPNAENLVAAGVGGLLSAGFEAEAERTGYYYTALTYNAPKLDFVDWKKAKPAQMLRLTKDKLRVVLQKRWSLQELKLWYKAEGRMPFAEYCNALELYGAQELARAVELDAKPLRVLRYCRKHDIAVTYLQDYWKMAAYMGCLMQDEAVRYPSDPRSAHDRVMAAQKYIHSETTYGKAFRAMTERCRGLNWVQGKICIRVAETPSELVDEGETLHHCVGGYAGNHAEGRIILFIRHTRRPERSWFTLNVDVRTKKIIQNHGYHNEHLNGRMLHIPPEVTAFVEAWEKEVLDKWVLPPEKKHKPPADAHAA